MNKRKSNGRRRRPQGKRVNRTRRFIMVEPEVKHHDVGQSPSIVNAGAVFGTPINGMLEGLGSEQRIGSKVHIHKVSFKGILTPTDTTDDGDVVRLMVVQDKQASGQTPTVANVLQSASPQSFRNRETTKRFNILFDKRIAWDSRSVGVENPPTTFVQRHLLVEFFKDVDIEVQYLSSAATYAAISTNSIFLLTISSEAGATDLSGNFRVSFTDV